MCVSTSWENFSNQNYNAKFGHLELFRKLQIPILVQLHLRCTLNSWENFKTQFYYNICCAPWILKKTSKLNSSITFVAHLKFSRKLQNATLVVHLEFWRKLQNPILVQHLLCTISNPQGEKFRTWNCSVALATHLLTSTRRIVQYPIIVVHIYASQILEKFSVIASTEELYTKFWRKL